MKITKKKWLFIGVSVFFCVIVLAALSGSIMSRVDEPSFTIVKEDADIQIRQYDPTIVAEVDVQGERLPAINQGFRLIADFIFGNNVSAKKIAMTAPVTQQAGEKIAMTAPVTQQSSGDLWKVRFVMPAQYTLQTLPVPNNEQVKILEVPARKVVVIRFSGFNSEKNINEHMAILREYIEKQQLEVMGEPTMAFYNPPWTLPFFKRNEIMFELK